MTRRWWRVVAVAALLSVAGVGTACASQDSPSPENSDQAPGAATSTGAAEELPDIDGDVIVYAAASLTAAFEDIRASFQTQHPSVEVVFNFGGSSGLVTQLQEGAPADVFASADERNMTVADDAGLTVSNGEVFATNTLEIAVPAGNPADITTFQDLAAPGLRLVICAVDVPCGAATARAAEAAGVTLAPVSEENAVTDVLGKVASGEADAGVVYRTDVASAGESVEGIAFDEAADIVNLYPIAALADAPNPEAAAAFIAFVTGPEGQSILASYGFGAPPAG